MLFFLIPLLTPLLCTPHLSLFNQSLSKLKSQKKGTVDQKFLNLLNKTLNHLEQGLSDLETLKEPLYDEEECTSVMYNNERVFRTDERFVPFLLLKVVELSDLSDEFFKGFMELNKLSFVVSGKEKGLSFVCDGGYVCRDYVVGCEYEFGK